MNMKGKEVLRAIADGADVCEFEVLFDGRLRWEPLWTSVTVSTLMDTQIEFRRNPRTRVVNGFTVPAPIQETPEESDELWVPAISSKTWAGCILYASRAEYDELCYSRGLLFTTKEAAIANAKAMVGIDPNGEA